MTKKTDLASLRGLTAIARRKMNQKYWNIPEPAEHAKKRDEAEKLYEKELKEQVAKHEKRYNSTAKTSLAFKSPNQVVTEYFSHSGV